jgi:hypothetical protein
MEPVRGEESGRGHSDGMWALGRVDVAEMKLDQQAWGRPEAEGRRRGYGGWGLAQCLMAPTEGAHESNVGGHNLPQRLCGGGTGQQLEADAGGDVGAAVVVVVVRCWCWSRP